MRHVTIKACGNGTVPRDMPDCINASIAERRLFAMHAGAGWRGRTYVGTPEGTLNSPTYWAQNPVARAGAVAICGTANQGNLTGANCAAALAADSAGAR